MGFIVGENWCFLGNYYRDYFTVLQKNCSYKRGLWEEPLFVSCALMRKNCQDKSSNLFCLGSGNRGFYGIVVGA